MKKRDLKRRIEALEAEVAALKANNVRLPNVTLPDVTYHTDACPAGGVHDYPLAWWGVVPPCCSKCGKPASMLSTTYTVNGVNA